MVSFDVPGLAADYAAALHRAEPRLTAELRSLAELSRAAADGPRGSGAPLVVWPMPVTAAAVARTTRLATSMIDQQILIGPRVRLAPIAATTADALLATEGTDPACLPPLRLAIAGGNLELTDEHLAAVRTTLGLPTGPLTTE